MNILGLDMSTKKSGYAYFNNKNLIQYGVWEYPGKEQDWRKRCVWMGDKLSEFCKKHYVDYVFCEEPIFMKNPKTQEQLSTIEGIVMWIVHEHNAKAIYLRPSEWRGCLGLQGSKLKREELKKLSIDYANKTFNLNLVWKSNTSKFNEDDIADSLNVAWSQISPCNGNTSILDRVKLADIFNTEK